jgi:hypothetical protein
MTTVLTKERTSLTCEALANSTRRWTITRESGKGPLCWWDSHDAAGLPCWINTMECLPKAYIVIKVALSAVDALVTRRWKVVTIAILEPHSFYTIIQHILPWLGQLPATRDISIGRGIEVREFFSLLNAGMFSLAAGCTCTGISICCACRRVDINQRKFVTQDCYEGKNPRGPDHWFSGMTDAVGDIAHGRLMWLACSCSSRAQECIVS